MADNFTANPGSGGDTFAADDVGGVKYPYSKIDIGGDGVSSPVNAANPMPVTAADLPLPTGAATEATLSTISGKIPALVNGRQPVLLAATNVDYWPGYSGADVVGDSGLTVDEGSALVTRGAVLTDEGTFRVNFANASLSVALGSVTVSGAVVTGSGFLSADVHYKDYFKLDADAETSWVQIKSVDSDTQITLRSTYSGGSSGAASRALVRPVTGSGGAISVASGVCTITSGTTNNANTRIVRFVDYAPLVYRAAAAVSQRIANQTIRLGLSEPFTVSDRWFARFKIDGTTNTTVICETGRNPTGVPSASETQSTTVTIPNAATSAVSNEYRIEMLTERVVFYINNVVVAQHTRVIPAQHDEMEAGISVINGTGAASSTTVTADYLTSKNHNKAEVGFLSDVEQVVAAQPPLSAFNYNVAGVIAINTDILIIPCAQFRTVNLQATSIGTTGRLDFFLTNDLTVVGTAQPAYPVGGAVAVTTTTAAGMWNIPTNGAAFLRVRMGVATTAGTTTVFATGSQTPHPFVIPTTQPVSGTVTANIGTGALAAGTNAIGDVGIQYRANATGAATTLKFAAAATVNNALVLTGARRLLGWSLTNTTASFKYFRFYNKATAPTSGESPTFMVGLPANSTVVSPPIVGGIAMSLGLGIACTGAVADTDATVTAVNDVVGSIYYA